MCQLINSYLILSKSGLRLTLLVINSRGLHLMTSPIPEKLTLSMDTAKGLLVYQNFVNAEFGYTGLFDF